MMRILSSLALSLLAMFGVRGLEAKNTAVDVQVSGNSFELVPMAIVDKVEINKGERLLIQIYNVTN